MNVCVCEISLSLCVSEYVTFHSHMQFYAFWFPSNATQTTNNTNNRSFQPHFGTPTLHSLHTQVPIHYTCGTCDDLIQTTTSKTSTHISSQLSHMYNRACHTYTPTHVPSHLPHINPRTFHTFTPHLPHIHPTPSSHVPPHYLNTEGLCKYCESLRPKFYELNIRWCKEKV